MSLRRDCSVFRALDLASRAQAQSPPACVPSRVAGAEASISTWVERWGAGAKGRVVHGTAASGASENGRV